MIKQRIFLLIFVFTPLGLWAQEKNTVPSINGFDQYGNADTTLTPFKLTFEFIVFKGTVKNIKLVERKGEVSDSTILFYENHLQSFLLKNPTRNRERGRITFGY